MLTSLSLDALKKELFDRLAQAEQRTQALEAALLREVESPLLFQDPVETPRPGRSLKPVTVPQQDVILSAVVSSLDDAIWSASPDGERLYILTGGVEIVYGRSAQDFLVVPGAWLDVLPPGDRETLREAFRDLDEIETLDVEHSVVWPDGSTHTVRTRGRLIRADDGQPLRVDGITSAVSNPEACELKERLAAAEAQVQEAWRLEVVGRMLSAAAHDFNNLLTIVTGHSELVRDQLAVDDPLREPVELIASSGHLAARVARQLLSYAQPAEIDSDTLEVNAAIRESERMLRRFVGERIELDFLLSPEIAPICVARSEFDRVVLNLVLNARDAVNETGVITVRTAMAHVSAGRRGWPDDQPTGDYVSLTITDTGHGMSEEVKARAFTRFFTTKGPKGTGLGLATVRDIVLAAGGHIELESSPDWGTSVRIFWPPMADAFPIAN